MGHKFLCPAVLWFGGCGAEMGKDGWNHSVLTFLTGEIPDLYLEHLPHTKSCVCAC